MANRCFSVFYRTLSRRYTEKERSYPRRTHYGLFNYWISAYRDPPRIKFATEAYFRSEIDADELKRVVSQQRMEQWTRQRDAGAGFIPSNDFSLYDGMLDTAYMLNAIPRRYADLRLSDIDTYFAMARGYQGAQGDVKAFTMKSGSIRTTTTWYQSWMMIWS